jgi:hypothetical protein
MKLILEYYFRFWIVPLTKVNPGKGSNVIAKPLVGLDPHCPVQPCEDIGYGRGLDKDYRK